MQKNGDSGDSLTPNTPNFKENQRKQIDSSSTADTNDISTNSFISQNDHFPVGSEENNLEILRKIGIRRKINFSSVDEQIRDSTVIRLIQIATSICFLDEPIAKAIKILDFNLYQEPDLKEQLDLLIATSLLMAAKLEDVKCSDLCQKIRNNFDGFEETDMVQFELKAFQNLNYDAIFSTAPQFLWFQLNKLCLQQIPQFDLISHYSRVICICALSSLKCCEYGDESIASESIQIANYMIQNEKDINELIGTETNELQKHIIQAMQKLNEIIPLGIFNGMIKDEVSQ